MKDYGKDKYDPADAVSIYQYAKRLEGRTLRDFIDTSDDSVYIGKGRFGQCLEKYYFGYDPNSNAEADFAQAGVELKACPLKEASKKGTSVKERLVLNIINYEEEETSTFLESSFWKKNNSLLLIFYHYDADKNPLDLYVEKVVLWRYPSNDMPIIRDDWEVIAGKIRDGKAHELSEGDTLYLGACTKGANSQSIRKQPHSDVPAKQRAYSLKQGYINHIFKKYRHVADDMLYRLGEDVEEYGAKAILVPEGVRFEDFLLTKFQQYYGRMQSSLMEEFGIQTLAKSQQSIIANKLLQHILGVDHIEEFEKADLEVKTVVLEANGKLKEHMSFKQIRYNEIIEEEWENSYWYETVTKRFLFVVFQKDAQGEKIFSKVLFWSMPTADIEKCRLFWEDTKQKISADDFDHFIKGSNPDHICHVRPKAKDSSDLTETATGRMVGKKAYWLNHSYIREVVG